MQKYDEMLAAKSRYMAARDLLSSGLSFTLEVKSKSVGPATTFYRPMPQFLEKKYYPHLKEKVLSLKDTILDELAQEYRDAKKAAIIELEALLRTLERDTIISPQEAREGLI